MRISLMTMDNRVCGVIMRALAVINRLRRPIVMQTALYSGAATLLKALGFAFSLWLARKLPVDEYARWGLLYALQTAVTLIGPVGIIEAVIGLLKSHRMDADKRRLFASANSVFLGSLGISVLLSLVIFFIFLPRSEATFVSFLCVVTSGGLMAFTSLHAQIVRLEEAHFASLYFSFLVPLTGLAGSVIAFVRLGTASSYFLGAAIGMAAALGAARVGRLGSFQLAGALTDCLPVLRRIAPFIAVALLGWLGGYGNSYIIKLLFSSAEVAKFTLAFMVVAGLQIIASAMNQAWSPRFFRMTHSLPVKEVEHKNQQFYRWQGVALGVTGTVVIASFPYAVRFGGGNLVHYQSMRVELLVLVLAYILLIPFWHCQNYLLAYDKGPSMMKIHVLSGIISFGGLIILVKMLGARGVYLAFLLQMALRSAGAWFAARKQWPIKISWGGVGAGVGLSIVGTLISSI